LEKYYILFNFDDTLRSVETLIHELGHSMHTFYSVKNQKIYSEYQIFYAEIASISNEILLANYLLKKYKNDSEMRKVILIQNLNGFFSTTLRQIEFSACEYEMNK
jgi:oligoendopeptidase F